MLIKKLYGPFKGLNKSDTPLLRGLPPAPNAAPAEYATEALNVYVDQETGDIIGRVGREYIDGQNNKSVAGLFPFNDFDPHDGRLKRRGVVMEIDPVTFAPTLYIYTLIKVEVRTTSNTLDGHTFAIEEGVAPNYNKTAIIRNSSGVTQQSTTTLDATLSALTNIQVNLIDHDEKRDGPIQMGMCDLLEPVTLTYSATNATGTSVAAYYTFARRTVTNADIDLSSYLDTEDDEDVTMWTAAQSKNCLYLSCGTTPVLKYDGQNIYKAGMPDAVIRPYTLNYNQDEGVDIFDASRIAPPDGAYSYATTFNYNDYKKNNIEGKEFFRDEAVATTILETRTNIFVPSEDGRVKITVEGLQPADGFNAKGAIFDAGQIITSGASDPVIDVTTGHTFEVGDPFTFRALLEGEFAELGKAIQILLLCTSRVKAVAATEITLDKTVLKVEGLPQHYVKSDFNSNSAITIQAENAIQLYTLLENTVKNFDDLIDFNWTIVDGIIKSDNLMGTDGDPANGIDLNGSPMVSAVGKWNYFNEGGGSYVDGEGGSSLSAGTTFSTQAYSAFTTADVNSIIESTKQFFKLEASSAPSTNTQGASYRFTIPELLRGKDITINIPNLLIRKNDGGFGAVQRYSYGISVYDIANTTATSLFSADDLITGVIPLRYYDGGTQTFTYTTANDVEDILISFHSTRVDSVTTEMSGLAWSDVIITMEVNDETVTTVLGLDDLWPYASNDLRLNVYRNKGEGLTADDLNTGLAPSAMYLQTILPNPKSATPVTYEQHDTLSDIELGYLYEPKTDAMVLFNEQRSETLQDKDYSPLPKGRHIFAFKDRLYLTNDPDNENILYRSSLVYGPEYFDTLNDALGMSTTQGDKTVGIGANNDFVYVMKSNSIKLIDGDFDVDKLRVLDLFLGEKGCVAPRSIISLDNNVVYLNDEGPVVIRDAEAVFLGASPSSGISRVRAIIKDTTTYDIKRAVACIDTVNEHYRLFLPYHDKPSVGLFNMALVRDANNPIYIDQGITLVYDYKRDAWFTQSGVHAKGGEILLDDGRTLNLAAYAINASATSTTLEWALYKDRSYTSLSRHSDRYRRRVSSSATLRGINRVYGTDWEAFEEPSVYKKFLRFKVLALQGDEQSLTVTSEKDWKEGTTQSSSTLTLGASKHWAIMKFKTNRCNAMRVKVSSNTLNKPFRISALEFEGASAFNPNLKDQ